MTETSNVPGNTRIDSYDRHAPRPKLGTQWVWEADSPEARCLVEVVEVFWNDEEWWVRTKTLLPDSYARRGDEDGTELLNDVSRFWEACSAVAAQPGVSSAPHGSWVAYLQGE